MRSKQLSNTLFICLFYREEECSGNGKKDVVFYSREIPPIEEQSQHCTQSRDEVRTFLAFNFCRFCVVFRFFHPFHKDQ